MFFAILLLLFLSKSAISIQQRLPAYSTSWTGISLSVPTHSLQAFDQPDRDLFQASQKPLSPLGIVRLLAHGAHPAKEHIKESRLRAHLVEELVEIHWWRSLSRLRCALRGLGWAVVAARSCEWRCEDKVEDETPHACPVDSDVRWMRGLRSMLRGLRSRLWLRWTILRRRRMQTLSVGLTDVVDVLFVFDSGTTSMSRYSGRRRCHCRAWSCMWSFRLVNSEIFVWVSHIDVWHGV